MSSKRRLRRVARRNACTGKAAHATPDDAHRAAGKLRAQGRVDGYLRVYRCPHCGAYHCGHPPGSGRSRP